MYLGGGRSIDSICAAVDLGDVVDGVDLSGFRLFASFEPAWMLGCDVDD